MISWFEIIIRLCLASLFGALIGLERERKDWTAGMRTHMMVCMGSALIMLVSTFGFSDILVGDHIVLDPSRIAAQVISGIGFIGAGTILFIKQGTIRGVTTASGLWTVAAIGLASGAGMYFAAGITTGIALIILWALQPFERMYSKKFKQKILRVLAASNIDIVLLLSELLEENKIQIQNFFMQKNEKGYYLELKFENTDMQKITKLISKLRQNSEIKEITWN